MMTRHRNDKSSRESGYVLLVLLLFMAVLSITMLEIEKSDLPYLEQQMRRDREEEMIHRGCEYARAVQKYYRKLGRYPSRIEDLENTNNMRFLRKRFKDPMNRDPKTGKELDFKPLPMTAVQTAFNPGAASMLPPGPDANISAANPTGAAAVTAEPANGDQSGAQAQSGDPASPQQMVQQAQNGNVMTPQGGQPRPL